MIDKSLFIVCPQSSPSAKYPTLKKSQESKKDIAFRLNFSQLKNQERNINHVMGTFEKPFATLGVNSELKKQFTQIIIDLKETFKQIDKNHSNKELNQKFWEQWNQFDTILHQMSVHSAYYYCSREIERLTLDITGAIKSIKSNPPAVPGIQHEFTVTVEKIQKSFVQIVDRFAEIVDSKIDESKKIRDLESMRNQIRQFRTDIVGDRSKFFSLSSANHATQEKAKQTIENSLNTIIATISDLKRQTYLLDNLDNEITQAMRVIEMMIDGDPLPNAKSERIQEKVKIEKENLIENNSVHSPTKVAKSNISRRCTISSSNNGNKMKRRSSRRRKSIKRNQSLIDLENSENESDASFCSTLSEFQDGKELLFDSSPINAELSDIDEDSMFQISDDDIENGDDDKEYDIPIECIQPNIESNDKTCNNNEEDNFEICHAENISLRETNLDIQGFNANKTSQLSDDDENNSLNSPSNQLDDLNDIASTLEHLKEKNVNKDTDESDNDRFSDKEDSLIHLDDRNIGFNTNGNDSVEDNNTIKSEDKISFIPDELIKEKHENADLTNDADNKTDNIPYQIKCNEEQKIDNSKPLQLCNVEIDKQTNEDSNTHTLPRPNKKRKVSFFDNFSNDNLDEKNYKNNKRRRSVSNSLLPTSDDSGVDEFLSSDLEEINIPLVCSCPLLTLDQGSFISQLSTSNVVSYEKFEEILPITEKKSRGSGSNCLIFLLVCFMMITFLLLFILNNE